MTNLIEIIDENCNAELNAILNGEASRIEITTLIGELNSIQYIAESWQETLAKAFSNKIVTRERS